MITKYLSTNPKQAITAYELASKISQETGDEINHRQVRKLIKEKRSSGIIWNNRGSYIENDINKRIQFINKQIKPSMYGFIKGMSNISNALGGEINLKLIKDYE